MILVLASSENDNNLKTKINSYFKLQFGDKMNQRHK